MTPFQNAIAKAILDHAPEPGDTIGDLLYAIATVIDTVSPTDIDAIALITETHRALSIRVGQLRAEAESATVH